MISDETFKDYQRKSGKNLALFLTNLFHLKLQQGIQEDTVFKHLHGLEWTRCEVKDKHKRIHIGYLSGKYQVPAESDEKREDEDIAYPVKVSILISGSLEDPLPEAVECAHLLANELSGMDAFFEASFHRANRRNFALALKNSADLLIYIGHGTEDGNLVFEDGMFGADDLKTFCDKGIDTSGLSGALFFACYGSVFSKHLRCPWIAFDKEVLREAPKAYLVQLFQIWREVNSLKEAIDIIWERLHENVVAELKHIFKQSNKKFPDSGLSKGKTKLINLSARMANCSYNDFIEVEIGKIRYPGFDPFIGKTGELASLLQLPSIDSLETIQQFQWVWGTAGMGKSSLLQQFAIYAAETILLPEKEQVILAHISCQAFTSQSEVISKLIDAFSQIFKAEIPSKNLQGLFSFTKQKRGTYIIILDDLSYLDVKELEDAEALVNRIYETARIHNCCCKIVASSRKKPSERFKPLEIRPLTPEEMNKLGVEIWRKETGGTISERDADAILRIGALTHNNTALLKKAMILSARNRITYVDYVSELGKRYSLARMDEMELAQAMIKHEVDLLKNSEDKDGFRYSRFLSVLYPLNLRIGPI